MKTIFTNYRLVLLLCIITGCTSKSFTQILSYTTATNGSPNFVAANANGTSLLRVNGAQPANSPCSTGFTSSNFSSTKTFSNSLSAIEVRVTPAQGFSLNITGFATSYSRLTSGPSLIRFAYSTDGGNTWISESANHSAKKGSCTKSHSLSWNTTVVVNSPATLIFRVYGFGASKSSGNEQISNLKINGTVSSTQASCATPSGLSANNITVSSATLDWNDISGATSYNIRYRVSGTTTWTNATSSTSSLNVSGLASSTRYEFQVETVCSGGSTSSFSSSSTFATSGSSTNIPTPDHIVVLILENHAYSQIIGSSAAPHINTLANDPLSALFTQSFAIEHPSQPNYLDLYSGSNQGVTDDNVPAGTTQGDCSTIGKGAFTSANLGKQLINAGKSWATYSEDLPCTGFEGATSTNYARKHNPAANWQGSGTNQIPSSANKPFSVFPSDFTQLPTVCYVIPNQNNDMHNGSDPSRITTADTWMFNNLDGYIEWAKTHNSLFILTFDEDNGSQGNRIVTIFTGGMVAGGQYSNTINHYSVLRTIEDMYRLPYAGNASSATSITNCWKSAAAIVAGNVTSSLSDNKVKITVYPNPATSMINFTLDKLPASRLLLRVFDITGRSVGEYQFVNSQSLRINTAHLSAGNYYYSLIQDKAILRSGMFVVGRK